MNIKYSDDKTTYSQWPYQLYNLFPSLTSYQNSCNYEVVHLDNMKVTYVQLSE